MNRKWNILQCQILPGISHKLFESTNQLITGLNNNAHSHWGCGTLVPGPRTFPALSDNALRQWTSRAIALGIFWRTMVKNTVAYSGPCQASKMEHFVKIINGF